MSVMAGVLRLLRRHTCWKTSDCDAASPPALVKERDLQDGERLEGERG